MKAKLLAIGALSLGLGACASNGALQPSVQNAITVAVADVQSAAAIACGCVPTATAIGSIVAAGDPPLATAAAIAEVLCAMEAQAQGTTVAALRSVSRKVGSSANTRLVPFD